tara:strand:- start:1889 stop:2203 length:315 start_codon:yes stop_codon:yes gene_type:complete
MSKKNYTFEQMMDFLRKERDKHVEEKEFQEAVKNVDRRKLEKKAEMKLHKKLTAQAKKAGHQSPGGLDLHTEENRYYTKENTDRWLESTSYFENYTAMRNQDDY